ncbi:MAG: RtcB family protein [Thermovenabulum sp.]|uniref:RtcB family protein n=1 Tax=Thermovenabulum sp. TaxID=3100335 RepID=UPI003C7E8A2B
MKEKLRKISTNLYEFENEENKIKINVYLSERLFNDFVEDESLKQLYNASMLKGVVSPVIGMPDIHTGFGLPIGGVMATDWEEGVVSAGAVGMDINCGVRLITTNIPAEELTRERLKKILELISEYVPSGVGKSSAIKAFRKPDLEAIASVGVKHFIDAGFGRKEDLFRIEDNGCITFADANCVPKTARERADQLCTIGGGNHFIEIGKISNIFDEKTAEYFGLKKGFVYVLIHTGSRGLGHQICTDFSKRMWENQDKNGTKAPVKGLACAPIHSEDGQKYLGAMGAAANYAFCNRQLITYFIREAFCKVFKKDEKELGLNILYDVAHNIAKKEKHNGRWLLVHRKGATRALPAGHPDNPLIFKETGHPAIIPGSMGTASYVLIGLKAISATFNSVNHGAGRVMSRKKAKEEFTKEELLKQLDNVYIASKDLKALLDEAPLAYKDIDEVVNTLVEAGLTQPIVRLKPMGVLKGEGEES